MKEFRPDGKGIQGEIEVCKHCRCKKCEVVAL
ncbi:uncharacterized protein METZ01_LOCUS365184 [marine metagenome]|uniref:Uncharacterized protein n=1 Tax=marine metagenome TaxID=408172 RepID=A0A382SQV0_9ZZZZ